MIKQKNNETVYDAVPVEMQELDHWVMWNYEDKTDKNGQKKVDENGEIERTKIPKQINGLNASSTDNSTWIDFDTAIENIDRFSGIGFMFQNSGITGIDLDHVETEITEYLDYLQNRPDEIEKIIDTNIVAEVIELTQSYAEISPSGSGVHVFVKGELAGPGKKNHFIEIYDKGRFFTVTGNQIGRYTDTNEDVGYLNYLCEKYFPKKINEHGSTFEVGNAGNNFTIEQLIEKIKASKSGQRFTDLFFDGNWAKYPQYPSQSEADLALASDLAWWTNYDIDKADQMFRMSALYREQWARTGKYAWTRILNNTNGRGYGAKPDIDVEINLGNLKENIYFDDEGFPCAKPKEIDYEKIIKNMRVVTDQTDLINGATGIDGNGIVWKAKVNSKGEITSWSVHPTYTNHENMMRLVGDFYFNEFSRIDEAPDVNNNNRLLAINKRYEAKMMKLVSHLYKFDLIRDKRENAILNLSQENRYHPIKMLIEHAKWDKRPRIETFFMDFFGLDDTPYHREATRKWFIAGVSRIYDPATKFDESLVIRGEQGSGKSTAIEKLAFGINYYLSFRGNPKDKDTKKSLQNKWIVELEEMKSVKDNDSDAFKYFLSNRADDYRDVYERQNEIFERSNIFIGTVNDKKFLKDKTGNRRWLVLLVDDGVKGRLSPHTDLTRGYVHQLWAEALTYYKQKESLVLSDATKRAFNVICGLVMEEDITEQKLLGFLELEFPEKYYAATLADKRLYLSGERKFAWGSNPAKRPDVTTQEILEECFGRDIDGDARGKQVAQEVTQIMSNLSNWKYNKHLRRVFVDGRISTDVRGYKRK